MQIKPMFTKFTIHEAIKSSKDTELVLFSGRLRSPNCTFIPRLKYRRNLSIKEDVYSNGAVGRKDVENEFTNIENPILTQLVHFFYDRMEYGKSNLFRRFFHFIYRRLIFKLLNK